MVAGDLDGEVGHPFMRDEPWVPEGGVRAWTPVAAASPHVSPYGHAFRVRIFPKKAGTLQGSSSLPTLPRAGKKLPSRIWNEEDKHWRRVALSHQGLFARTVPPELEWGSTTGHRFHAHGLKDLHASSSSSWRPASSSSSTAPPPSAWADASHGAPSQARNVEAALGVPAPRPTSSQKMLSMKEIQEHKDLFDIRQGFRVAILNVPPLPLSADKVWPPPKKERPPPTKDEVYKVYLAFITMLELEGKLPWADADRASEFEESPEVDICAHGLSTISWKTLLSWVETGSIGLQVRLQCAYDALLRGLKGCKRDVPPDRRRLGVSMSMIFRWIWPFLGPSRLLQMHTWVCYSVLEQVQLAIPDVIPERERRDITNLYLKMDLEGKGYCNTLDIAGGDHSDRRVQLANTIDEATVKEILGDRVIPLQEFLELMCEDGYRGSPDSTRAILEDGRHIVKLCRESVDWEGWVYREAPPEQEVAFRIVDVLEAEVAHWEEQLSKKGMEKVNSSSTVGSGF